MAEFHGVRMDEFSLSCDDERTWLQCTRCFETWEVVNLAQAVKDWNEHSCKNERKTV